ncbi:ATP-binding protein [Kitasatospora sp. NPDC058201]|uniref:ATP-binding protein n=1 Tax=unclassified Kitasatospora TaxID=2633591 RepID=UPI0036606708
MTQWCATATGVLAALALVAAARYRAVSATQRRRVTQQQREIDRLKEQLTAELSRRGAELAAVQQEQELNASTQRAFLSVARRILVMAHDQQALLDEMERTHDDPALLEGLLKADHAAAQQARLAQTLAVLCGARAGRHWPEPVTLEDVVRGAQSRILPFQRVVVRSRIETAVVGAAAEALIHAVAELLDNATRYSPPSTQVFVTLMPVHNGAVIEIDDGGVGMPEQAVSKAAAALGGGPAIEVSRLGEVPQLGLAAVGRLSEQYGFRVTLSSAPSPYGGVRVVVLLPNALLTEPLPSTVPGLGTDDAVFGHGPRRSAAPRSGSPAPGRSPAHGPQGTHGPQGPYGSPDAHGAHGSPGVHGSPGAYGQPDGYGQQGAFGAPGAYGQQGPTGPQSAQDPYGYPAPSEYPPLYPPATGYPPVAGTPGAPGIPSADTPSADRPAEAGATPPPLPRRSHRRDRANRHAASAAPTPPAAPPYRSAQQAQTFMAMFQAGTASGRSAVQAQAHSPGHPQGHPQGDDRAHSPGHGQNPGRSHAPHDPSLPASPQLPQRSGEFHDHHP